jgi:hypothetical protein
MHRSFFLAASMALLLPACSTASAPAGLRAPPPASAAAPLNIGFVLYTRSGTPGTLNARWNYANAYSGPGVASGGPASGGFAGRYHVRYFLENGAFSDEYDLEIQRHSPGDFYDVTWIANGTVSARGVGMEVADGNSLAVGWRRISD